MKRRFKTAPPIVQSAAPNVSNRSLIKFQTPPRPEKEAGRPVCWIKTQCYTTSYQHFSSDLVHFADSNAPFAGFMAIQVAAQIATLNFKAGLNVAASCS